MPQDPINPTILQKAVDAAKPVYANNAIPADANGVVSLPVVDAIKHVMDHAQITVGWETHHYDEGVIGALEAGDIAFTKSKGDTKLRGYEIWDDPENFSTFMKTGQQQDLPEPFRSNHTDFYGAISRYLASFQLMQKSQLNDTGTQIQTIHLLPHDDKSLIYQGVDKDGFLIPDYVDDLQQLKQTKPEAFKTELERRTGPERTELMNQKIHNNLANQSPPYDRIYITAGADHAGSKTGGKDGKDLDELLAHNPNTDTPYKVSSIAYTNHLHTKLPPGVYTNKKLDTEIEWGGSTFSTSYDDQPDLLVNYLPWATPEEFDARVQSRSFATRKKINDALSPAISQLDDSQHAIIILLGFSERPADVEQLQVNYFNVHTKLKAWDFDGAQKQIAVMEKTYGHDLGKMTDIITQFRPKIDRQRISNAVQDYKTALLTTKTTLENIQNIIKEDAQQIPTPTLPKKPTGFDR